MIGTNCTVAPTKLECVVRGDPHKLVDSKPIYI